MTISSLREQLDESSFKAKTLVQEAISSKNDSVSKLTITELRYQLDKSNLKKKSCSKSNSIKC